MTSPHFCGRNWISTTLHEKVAPAPLGRSTLWWLLAWPAPRQLSSAFSISNGSPWSKYIILQNISELRKSWTEVWRTFLKSSLEKKEIQQVGYEISNWSHYTTPKRGESLWNMKQHGKRGDKKKPEVYCTALSPRRMRSPVRFLPSTTPFDRESSAPYKIITWTMLKSDSSANNISFILAVVTYGFLSFYYGHHKRRACRPG